jgi:hypothetical protein
MVVMNILFLVFLLAVTVASASEQKVSLKGKTYESNSDS